MYFYQHSINITFTKSNFVWHHEVVSQGLKILLFANFIFFHTCMYIAHQKYYHTPHQIQFGKLYIIIITHTNC